MRRFNPAGCIFAMALAVLNPPECFAQYHNFNVTSGSDCIMQDYRSPDVPPGIYDAIHEENVTSSDSGAGYFYGGFTHQNQLPNGSFGTLVQYVCWPATGGYAPYSQQIPFFAGTNMVGYPQIGEGSSCAIKGYWPQFTSNLWTREAVRYWLPSDGTPHLGYQGMWIKDPVTANWDHVGTFLYPFAVTGVTGMSGWQENFSGYTGDYKVNHANGYYHINGAWHMANQIQYTSAGYVYLINTNAASESDVGHDYTNSYNNPQTLIMSGQPSAPTFDPIIVTNFAASVYGSQLLVQWQLPLSSSPQLSYRVDVFNNSAYSGIASLSYNNNDPEARQVLLTLTNVATPYVRLTISDIFFNTNAPILITPALASPSAATNISGTVGGLAFQYYESASGDWGSLPNFSALTPIYTGAVGFTDVTPRRQRTDYGFNYSGFINAPATGVYAFSLHSGDGSELVIDGTNVIDFDGLHDSSQFKSGGIALAAGPHAFNLQFFKGAANPVNSTAYTDGIGLAWQIPGATAAVDVPASAYSRTPANGEPLIVLTAPLSNSTVPNFNPGLSATVRANGNAANGVLFYLTDYSAYYAHPAAGMDYYLGRASTTPYSLNSMIWSARTNLVRARLIYNGTNIIDSAPVGIVTTNGSFGAWAWSPLEMHNYPSGGAIQGSTFSLLGDGMNFISRKVTGDSTLVARLAGLTPNQPSPDGVSPGGSWRAGIIFRGTTNATIGQPLGDGSTTRFAALFSAVEGGTYYENDTMRNGNGDANAWSGNLGSSYTWYKIQRAGDVFTSFISADGQNWIQANTITLTGIGTSIYAGVFINAEQSFNPNIHSASFDSFSLTGTNVAGAASVSISPATNSIVGGQAATFAASVVGPVPAGFQWQLNGTNIASATNATYSIASVTAANAGTYTVIANGVTSAPALLTISAPAGSGVWINGEGGSWSAPANWSGGLAAGGTNAVGDFSTLELSLNPTVTLNTPTMLGTLVSDDQNPSVKHNWTYAPTGGATLTLAVSSGTPNVSIKSATNFLGAAVAGAQGFTKTGPGDLTLSAASTFTGGVSVSDGTLEVQNKSGDVTYSVAAGATLKIGYTTGGGYANTGLSISGNGASDPSGFYLAGGRTYNCSGEVILQGAPTTIRQYGSGLANLGTYDINGTGLWCTSAASGSATDANVQMVSDGYGMSVQVDPGANTATGDLTINGPLNVGSLGFYLRGNGSVLLNGTAPAGNAALQITSGTVICGAANCIGASAALIISPGATLNLNGFSQTIAASSGAGTTSLGGKLLMTINGGASPGGSTLAVPGANPLAFGGSLVVTNIGGALAAGQTFTLFTAQSYSRAFTNFSLPTLPPGLIWQTNNLPVNGSISINTNGLSTWNGNGSNANWSTAANWIGSTPANQNSLMFAGNAQQTSTNNFLSAVGQVIFSNGGFSLTGNAVSSLWGIVNQAGNNTWSIPTTLSAAQSFISSNGTLTVAGAVATGGNLLTLDGAGAIQIANAISGAGGLQKNGTGTASLNVQNSFTGGTTINSGILNLTGGGGSSGTIRGAVTVNSGGILELSTADAIGYGGGTTALTNISLAGGTLNVATSVNQTLGSAIINLTGGAITGNAGGNIDFYGGGSALNSWAASKTSTISGVPLSPLRQGSTTFTVQAGTTPSGIDLDISSTLQTSPNGDASGASLYKAGSGTLRLSGTNTYAKPTIVSAGTLWVTGSLGAASRLSIAKGATLGGTGAINGPATVQAGGMLTVGTNSIGTLAFGSSLNLAGSAWMKISRNGGMATNDLALVAGQLAEAGTLIVTNAGTNLPALGDSYKLFSAAQFSGSFTNFNLPTLPSTLLWSTSNLAASGVLLVVTNPPVTSMAPADINFSLAGSTLTLSWPVDHVGWALLAQTNNLQFGLSLDSNDWGAVSDSTSTNAVTVRVSATNNGYYRLVYP